MISYGMTKKEVKIKENTLARHNKIFASGKTVIVVGG